MVEHMRNGAGPGRRPIKPGADPIAVWLSFTRELALDVELWKQLLLEHQPTLTPGLCRACTRPGQGTPHLAWPCSLWSLADAARRHHQVTADQRGSQRRGDQV